GLGLRQPDRGLLRGARAGGLLRLLGELPLWPRALPRVGGGERRRAGAAQRRDVGRSRPRDRPRRHPLRHGRRLGAPGARLPSLHRARDARPREQPGGGARPRALPAHRPVPAHPPRAAPLPRPARAAPSASGVADGARRRAGGGRDGRGLRGGRADRERALARCLTRLVPCFVPAEVTGDIRLLGASIRERRVGELAGTIGMVFQDFEAQLFSTDVTQEVVFGLEHTAVPPAEMPERIARALATVGLAGFEGRDPTTLSGGEKQRLAIAGLLALRPPVMVLDEPTTDLDPVGRAEVLRTLAGLRGDGLTLVVIEHDTAAAAGADPP